MIFIMIAALFCYLMYVAIKSNDVEQIVVTVFLGLAIGGLMTGGLAAFTTATELNVVAETSTPIIEMYPTSNGNLALTLITGEVHILKVKEGRAIHSAGREGSRLVTQEGYYDAWPLVPWNMDGTERKVYLPPIIMQAAPTIEDLLQQLPQQQMPSPFTR